MKQLFDLADGEEFGMYVLLKNANVRKDRNGNNFIAMTFQDRSGSMDGMYWSATQEEVNRFQAGRVVYLRGVRNTYNGQAQVKIDAIRLAEPGEPTDPSLYVERVAAKRSELEADLEEIIYQIKEPNIARVVRKILKDVEDEFYTYPAASRNHHAAAGGLSYHTVTMLKIGASLLDIYPDLNPSLLIGGIILHDIGKVEELSGVISTEYTLEGNMVGHIVIGVEMIDKACNELGIDPQIEPIVLLKHVVLASHGKLEYGSPVTPRLLEAEVLSHIDNIDARINMITDSLKNTEKGDYTESIYSLEKRKFYKPNFD